MKHELLAGEMDERTRRLWAASEAQALGYGGISTVARATGMAISTIRAGVRELAERDSRSQDQTKQSTKQSTMQSTRRVRQPGGGRKKLVQKDAQLVGALESLLDSSTRGDPMSALRWTCKSTRKLARELTEQGHRISHKTVADLLVERGYSLQANRKTQEGSSHPDRDAQFEHIAEKAKAFAEQGQPVISVDTKKKELAGNFKNNGQEWCAQGCPAEVQVHDFPDPNRGKAIPYGVYDMTRNNGWVSVGTDHDTAAFAVQTIRNWWRHMGSQAYPHARQLLITADSGGSNGHRNRLWKLELQKFADETGLCLHVCHFPPGTSKWNKIEHQMFSHITRNWRGRPLETLGVIVNLIGHTTTERGLHIRAKLDKQSYPKGIKVTPEQMSQVNIKPDPFHGDWNYEISRLENSRD